MPVQAIDQDGKPEWRIRSFYLLTNVIGIAPERITVAHGRHLGAIMCKLGWSGPKNLRFGVEQAKGYYRAADEKGIVISDTPDYARSA
jgi:hypothetical protein